MVDSSGGICEKVNSKYSAVLARSSGYLKVLSTKFNRKHGVTASSCPLFLCFQCTS